MTSNYARAYRVRDLIAHLDQAVDALDVLLIDLDVLADTTPDDDTAACAFEQINAALGEALDFLEQHLFADRGEIAMSASPTCVVEFVDGEITRMTTWSATGKPDVRRGITLAYHAYRSRTGREPCAITREGTKP